MKFKIFLALSLILSACGVSVERASATPTPPAPGDHLIRLDVNGEERLFILHVSPILPTNQPLPLVFDLHGYSGSTRSQMGFSFMAAEADNEGFLIVNSQGYGNPAMWIDYYPGDLGLAQITFFEAISDYLQARYEIDTRRIYVPVSLTAA